MTVLDRSTKLRLRRVLRRRQKQVASATSYAESQFERNVLARLDKLLGVRRFMLGWLFLVVTATLLTSLQLVGLSEYYLKAGPAPGGVHSEGVVGVYSNANPIYAVGPVDTNVSRLLFAGLFKYDDSNQLVGDLAKSYEVDETGRTYTVRLKPHLTWHDTAPLTSRDVVFTYTTIQKADARSPLFTSWQGIDVRATAPDTIVFRLPNALTAFPYSLTTGIIPEHILGNVPAAQLRSHRFNIDSPIGAGPFQWEALQLSPSADTTGSGALISLKRFPGYNGGAPKLDGFIVHAYGTPEELIAAYKRRAIEAMVGLEHVPADIARDTSSEIHHFTTTAATMVFFKTTHPLLNDVAVRRALVLAADRGSIIHQLDYTVRPLRMPLLRGQLGYDRAYEQPSFNLAAAAGSLDQAGWVMNKDGVRAKAGQQLRLQVLAEDTSDTRTVLASLQKTWKALGVAMQPVYQQAAVFQSSVEMHDYTALLYGISIGPDPDVFVYWDSSQTDVRSPNRLNFSEYKSTTADAALEAGRTRQDPAVRAVKYRSFLKTWQEDYPALALYQPDALYVARGGLTGLHAHTLNTDADRYYSVANWSIKTAQVPKN